MELGPQISEGETSFIHAIIGEPKLAAKVIKRELLGHLGAVEAFFNEMKISSFVTHQFVARFYEKGTMKDGRHFITTDFLHGETLDARLARQKLPVGETIAIAIKIAMGMCFVHKAGVIHLDLKPANVFLCNDGNIRIIDFGQAKFPNVPRANSLSTPLYMAPECWVGGTKDGLPASDVYSFGCLLYHVLTGRPPFDTPSFVELSPRHLHETPSPVVGISPKLTSLVSAMLFKESRQRPSMKEVLRSLMELYGHSNFA